MKILKYLSVMILLILSSIVGLLSLPGVSPNLPSNCDTSGTYDGNTRLTVFGDSRLAYMGTFYPYIDHFLGAFTGGWSVQNLASNGLNSDFLLAHLRGCMQPPAVPPATLPATSNYKTHKNVLYHIGGNDFVNNALALYFMPWTYPQFVRNSADNNDRILTIFYLRGKNVLLGGHYPALSSSLVFGKPEDYTKSTGIKLGKYFDWTVDAAQLQSQIAGCSVNEGLNTSSLPALSIFWAYAWKNLAANLGTLASFGVTSLEPLINDMYNRRKSYFTNKGQQLEYQPVWNCLQAYWNTDLRLRTAEPYVMNPWLASDFIHPNATGFTIWGMKIGSKIDQIGFSTSLPVVAAPQGAALSTSGNAGGANTDANANNTPVDTGNTTNLLILCFLTGYCHP